MQSSSTWQSAAPIISGHSEDAAYRAEETQPQGRQARGECNLLLQGVLTLWQHSRAARMTPTLPMHSKE